MSAGAILTVGLGSFGSVNLLPTLGYLSGGEAPAAGDVIRNFSLRNWRRWTRKELEEGELPEDLRVEADQAVKEAVQASVALASGRVDPGAALLVAMEAREAYESAYRAAYASAYVAEIVAENWRRDMAVRARRRRAAALLLLH